MIPLTEHRPASDRHAKNETGASQFVPYACHFNDQTLLTKSGDLVQVIRLEGFSFETADYDDIDLRKRLRNVLLKSVASHQYALWFHTLRTKQSIYPKGDFEGGSFSELVNDTWKERNAHCQLFENQLYISIVRRAPTLNLGGLDRLIGALSHEKDVAHRKLYLQTGCQELSDVTRRFFTALADYNPHILTVHQTNQGQISEPLSFMSRLINQVEQSVLVPTMDVARYLPSKRLFIGHNAIEIRGSVQSRYAAIVSIKEYGADTAAGLLDSLLQLPYEFILTQSFIFSDRQIALGKIQLQQRRMEQTDDLAQSQIEGIDDALDDAMSGEIAFGQHHLTILPIVDKHDELKEAVAEIESKLIDAGIISVREDLNLEACYWAQLPGNTEYISRGSTISTANVAGFASLHNYHTGSRANNHWGPAVTLLQTQSGTPYFFNFHVNDVGHTLLIGPTGSGKTALLNFLCAQARKFKCRLFYFDRNRGSEIFIRAIGGTYSILGEAHHSGFNPLQLPDSPQNRAFLTDWLCSLVQTSASPLTHEEIARLGAAVEGCYRLMPEQRTLANIAPFVGLGGPGSLANRLSVWHSGGTRSMLFGHAKDTLSLGHHVMGFEMAEILENPQTLSPVLMYLFHRISMVLDGTPTMIVLEEAAPLLKNPLIAPKVDSWLKTFRKLNALVIMATQSVDDILQSPASASLVSETATQIYFPNPKATDAYCRVFKLSERELQLVSQSLSKSSRYFLLKHGRDSAVARVDLSGMTKIMAVLSGRAETVARVDQLRAQVGDEPSIWLPLFMEDFNENHASA